MHVAIKYVDLQLIQMKEDMGLVYFQDSINENKVKISNLRDMLEELNKRAAVEGSFTDYADEKERLVKELSRTLDSKKMESSRMDVDSSRKSAEVERVRFKVSELLATRLAVQASQEVDGASSSSSSSLRPEKESEEVFASVAKSQQAVRKMQQRREELREQLRTVQEKIQQRVSELSLLRGSAAKAMAEVNSETSDGAIAHTHLRVSAERTRKKVAVMEARVKAHTARLEELQLIEERRAAATTTTTRDSSSLTRSDPFAALPSTERWNPNPNPIAYSDRAQGGGSEEVSAYASRNKFTAPKILKAPPQHLSTSRSVLLSEGGPHPPLSPSPSLTRHDGPGIFVQVAVPDGRTRLRAKGEEEEGGGGELEVEDREEEKEKEGEEGGRDCDQEVAPRGVEITWRRQHEKAAQIASLSLTGTRPLKGTPTRMTIRSRPNSHTSLNKAKVKEGRGGRGGLLRDLSTENFEEMGALIESFYDHSQSCLLRSLVEIAKKKAVAILPTKILPNPNPNLNADPKQPPSGAASVQHEGRGAKTALPSALPSASAAESGGEEEDSCGKTRRAVVHPRVVEMQPSVEERGRERGGRGRATPRRQHSSHRSGRAEPREEAATSPTVSPSTDAVTQSRSKDDGDEEKEEKVKVKEEEGEGEETEVLRQNYGLKSAMDQMHALLTALHGLAPAATRDWVLPPPSVPSARSPTKKTVLSLHDFDDDDDEDLLPRVGGGGRGDEEEEEAAREKELESAMGSVEFLRVRIGQYLHLLKGTYLDLANSKAELLTMRQKCFAQRLATQREKARLLVAVDENGYDWDADTLPVTCCLVMGLW